MQFSFVAYEGPQLPPDPDIRTLIRKRAMADAAAARKQKGNYGKHNLRQLPVYPVAVVDSEPEPICGGDSGRSGASAIPSRQLALVTRSGSRAKVTRRKGNRAPENHIRPIPSLYPGLGISGDFFALISLIPLTGLRLGIAPVCHSLAPRSVQSQNIPSFLTGGKHLGNHPMLSFIPSRYGQVSSITHAVDCVLAKLKQTLQCEPLDGDAVALRLYSKALRTLQEALNDGSQCMSPETLCATELLGVFEVRRSPSAPSRLQSCSNMTSEVSILSPRALPVTKTWILV